MPSNDRPAPNRRLAKGEKLAPLNERLARLGLVKDWDFVLHLPLRYEDLTRVTPFSELSEGVNALVEGTVTESTVRQAQWRVLTVIITSDEGERMQLRFLHFYPSSQKRFAPGVRLRAYGSARMTQHGIWEMVHPKIFMGEAADQALEETLTPVYPTGENVTQPVLRKRIARALLDVDLIDLMPQSLRRSLDVPDLAVALRNLHRPKPDADFAAYSNKTAPEWRRVKLDELLAQQITLEKARRDRRSLQAAPLFGRPDGLYTRFLARLPFALTGAQQRVLKDILADLARSTPMHRLVQGDVGCGKTIVAALACLQAVDSGRQTA
ncbi:MAG: ATP-dependent DNA helicase RecG, partial [Duodenibacillus sp.]|nr:ATP-dependent DNA helicase RecG [Duodenibacillus sp.]